MYSNFIKFLLTLTGLSPVLLSFWVVKTIQNYNKLTIYFEIESLVKFHNGFFELLSNHYLLLIFILIVFISKYLLQKAVTNLPQWTIEIKSIKPADINFFPILISYVLPFFKFFLNNNNDFIFLFGFILICVVYAIIGKNSYHNNLNFRLFLGYRNYEIQTKREVTYLMLSAKKLINTNQVNIYVQLTDYMIINVS